MFVVLKRLLYDEAYFSQYARMLVFLAGELAKSGMLGTGAAGSWAGYVIQAAALFIRVGEPNK